MILDLANLKANMNDIFFDLILEKSRYLVLMGGGGSGKSWGTAQKIIARILNDGINKGISHKIMAVRKTQPAVRKSVYSLFDTLCTKWQLYDGNLVRQNKSDLSYHFNLNGVTSQILCNGVDDVTKLKSIEGITGFWLEEATEFNAKDFHEIDLRLRGKSKAYKQIILSFNPISKLNWTHKTFFEKPKENTKTVITTYRDNRFIDQEYIRVLNDLKEQDITLWEIYAEGIWGTLRNIIYQYSTINDFNGMAFDETVYGIDFGYNNPMAVTQINFKEDQIYEREILYETHLKTNDLIERLNQSIPQDHKQKYFYCDPSRPDAIDDLVEAGFNAHKANNKVIEGIEYCRRLKPIVEESSVNLIKEYDNYKYKEDKNGNVLEDPVKFRDHLMDAGRYAKYSYFLETKDSGDWASLTTVQMRDE